MICHLCHREAVGQCHSCLKFYCPDHGDRVCAACRPLRSAAAEVPAARETAPPREDPTAGAACFACKGVAEGSCRFCGRFYCVLHGRDATCADCYDRFRVRHGALGVCFCVLLTGFGLFSLVGPFNDLPGSQLIGIGSCAAGVIFLGIGLWVAMRSFP
jgi:hypothetical protein